MADYKLIENDSIMRLSDGVMFPPDDFNMYYKEYLVWVEAGGVPDPYVPPPPRPVTSVTPVQGRIALLNAGLLDAATAAVEAAGGATAIWWEYATEWERNNSLLIAMGTSLGLTLEQIDQLFEAAAQIK